mmetsp:Transcript_46913/g.73428  ORF Transcript_46913/g.73428 Transcript_46913/m.73428 type:complete len:304 (-) Transcript_46913:1014-1925(-)
MATMGEGGDVKVEMSVPLKHRVKPVETKRVRSPVGMQIQNSLISPSGSYPSVSSPISLVSFQSASTARMRSSSQCSVASMAPSDTELNGVGYNDLIDRYLPHMLAEDEELFTNLPDVEADFRKKLRGDPTNRRLLTNYGTLVYSSSDNFGLAAELLEKAVAYGPDDDDTLNSYGHFFFTLAERMRAKRQQGHKLLEETEEIFLKAIRWQNDMALVPSGYAALKARQHRLKPEAMKGMIALISKHEQFEKEAMLRKRMKQAEEERQERERVIQERRERQSASRSGSPLTALKAGKESRETGAGS